MLQCRDAQNFNAAAINSRCRHVLQALHQLFMAAAFVYLCIAACLGAGAFYVLINIIKECFDVISIDYNHLGAHELAC